MIVVIVVLLVVAVVVAVPVVYIVVKRRKARILLSLTDGKIEVDPDMPFATVSTEGPIQTNQNLMTSDNEAGSESNRKLTMKEVPAEVNLSPEAVE